MLFGKLMFGWDKLSFSVSVSRVEHVTYGGGGGGGYGGGGGGGKYTYTFWIYIYTFYLNTPSFSKMCNYMGERIIVRQ